MDAFCFDGQCALAAQLAARRAPASPRSRLNPSSGQVHLHWYSGCSTSSACALALRPGAGTASSSNSSHALNAHTTAKAPREISRGNHRRPHDQLQISSSSVQRAGVLVYVCAYMHALAPARPWPCIWAADTGPGTSACACACSEAAHGLSAVFIPVRIS